MTLSPAIRALLFSSGPSHVSWFIVAIIVYAVHCVFSGWSLAKFFEELRKRSKAESYSSTSIILPPFRFLIFCASALCQSIRSVFRGVPHPVAFTSSKANTRSQFSGNVASLNVKNPQTKNAFHFPLHRSILTTKRLNKSEAAYMFASVVLCFSSHSKIVEGLV